MDYPETLKDLSYLFTNSASNNISFREFAKSDVFPLFNATRHPEFNKYLLWSAPPAIGDLVPEVEKLIKEKNRNENLVLSMCSQESGTWFGFLKITPFREQFEISYWIHPNYWANKLVIEAGWSLIDIYFNNKDIHSLFCRVRTDNRKMEKLLKYSGFSKIDETYANHENGTKMHFNVFSIEKALWKNKNLIFSY